MYLHAALVVIRYGHKGRFLILHPHSAAVLSTDALGARGIYLFISGQNASAIGRRLELQCTGAEKRWQRLVGDLFSRGAVGFQAPSRTYRWWLRRVCALLLGQVLSLATSILRILPVWILSGIYDRLPFTPLGIPTFRHLCPFVDSNLRAAGYRDQLPAWRRNVARRVAAATIRTHFVSYLLLILPPTKVARIVERLTDSQGMHRITQALEEHKGAIVVGLHWELFLAAVILVGRARPATVLADLGMADYSVAADMKQPLSPFNEWVDSAAPMAAKALVQSLRTGRIVMLAIDVATPSPIEGAAPRRISFLGHTVRRFDTAAWLSTRADSPILFVSIYRKYNRLIMDFSAPLMPASNRLSRDGIATLTTQIYETAERLVRLHPDAWLVWSYLHTLTVAAPESHNIEPSPPRNLRSAQ